MPGRSLVATLPIAIVIAWAWSLLEAPSDSREVALAAAVGLLPAIVRATRLRVAVAALIGTVGICIAFGAHPRQALRELERALRDAPDVASPFDPGRHPGLHALVVCVVLVAVLVAATSRRPLVGGIVIVVGIGWPATLLEGGHGLSLGAAGLAAALWQPFVVRRSSPVRSIPGVALIGCVVAAGTGLAAVGPGAESHVAWKGWSPLGGDGNRVAVSYVWDASYAGIRFPARPTVVLRIRAPRRSLYWRASALDLFTGDRWVEGLYPVDIDDAEERDLPDDPLLPARAARRRDWVKQTVTVEALEGSRIVAAAQPTRISSGTLGQVVYQSSGVMSAHQGLRRGQEYTVWSYAPAPTPKALVTSPPRYPPGADRFLALGRANLPSFGVAGRVSDMEKIFADQRYQPLWAYRPLWHRAERLAADAGSPYEATIAIERWFRTTGGFTYQEQPPAPAGLPPLVDFVVRTRQGYCQHYAGAMAVMLRTIGIPARVAVGFTSGTWRSGAWTVTDHQAHAWVEAWFAGYGWLTFDPTPGRGLLSVAYTLASDSADAVRALGTGRFLDFTPDPSAPTSGRTAALRSGPGRNALWLWSLLAAAIGAGLVSTIPFAKAVRRRKRLRSDDPRVLAGGVRDELVSMLRDNGVPVSRSAGLGELGAVVESTLGRGAVEIVGTLARARFGPPSGAQSAAVESVALLDGLRRTLARRLGTGGRVRAALSAASLRRA